jgi:septum site-determining protein MinC
MEVVDLLARLSVDVVRVTGLPPDLMQSVRFLFAAPQVPSWRAVPDVDPRSIDYRVRSGVCVTHLSGDVELLDTLAAGGDVRAGGSVRIAGAMRGTVTAGHLGLSTAAIVCRSFNPELVSICGAFVTGDRLDPALIGRAVRITLSSGGIRFQPVDPATV